MEFYEAVAARHTIRDFTGEPVDLEAVKRVLAAGMQAPTNDHLRNWEFLVVDDPDQVTALLKKIPKRVTEKRLDFILKGMNLREERQKAMYTDAVPK